jgi:hypothetical protein
MTAVDLARLVLFVALLVECNARPVVLRCAKMREWPPGRHFLSTHCSKTKLTVAP